MVTWVINGKNISCPSCYDDLTTKKFVEIITEWEPEKDIAERDFFKLFCMLSGTQYAGFENKPETELSIWNAVSWFLTSTPSKEVPGVLKVQDNIVMLPEKDSISIGQMISIRRKMQACTMMEEVLIMALATGLQPIIDGEYNIAKAEALEEVIAEMPVSQTYGAGFFFLNHALSYGQHTTIALNQILNNLRQSLNRLWPGSQRFGGLMRSMISP